MRPGGPASPQHRARSPALPLTEAGLGSLAARASAERRGQSLSSQARGSGGGGLLLLLAQPHEPKPGASRRGPGLREHLPSETPTFATPRVHRTQHESAVTGPPALPSVKYSPSGRGWGHQSSRVRAPGARDRFTPWLPTPPSVTRGARHVPSGQLPSFLTYKIRRRTLLVSRVGRVSGPGLGRRLTAWGTRPSPATSSHAHRLPGSGQ